MEDQQSIIRQLEEWQKKTCSESNPEGKSWAKIAREIGIADSTLTQVRNDKYPANADKVICKIEAYLRKLEKRKNGPQELRFVNTKNSVQIFDVCEYAMNQGAMTVITGQAGIGKTFSLRKFQETHQNVHYIYTNQMTSTRALLNEFARGVRVSVQNRADVVLRHLIEKITHSMRIFIIDEAHKLNYRTIELVREIHDQTEVGVVLSGDVTLIMRITGQDQNRTDRTFDQLYSRVQRFSEIEPFNLEETGKIIATVFDDLSESVIRRIYEKTGGIGRRINFLVKAIQENGFKENIGVDNIDKSSEFLIKAA